MPIKVQKYLSRFAGDPRQRFKLFLVGMVLFVTSLIALYTGAHLSYSTPEQHSAVAVWLTRTGTITLVSSLLLCAYCYISMLIGRLLHFWES